MKDVRPAASKNHARRYRHLWGSLRVLDYAIFLIGLAVIAGSVAFSSASRGDTAVLHIRGEGSEWLYPLDTEMDVEVPGPLGITWVHIGDGGARVVDSPCRHKICVAAGQISRVNAWVACLPNRVFINIEGTSPQNEDGVDAVSF